METILNKIQEIRELRHESFKQEGYWMHSTCDWCGDLMDNHEAGGVAGIFADFFGVSFLKIEEIYKNDERICSTCKNFIKHKMETN